MRITHRPRRHTAGNTLLLSLVITGLIGFILLAYLSLVRTQNMATMRSQAWNGTVPIIEAGIEDALAHLNRNAGGSLACDGWSQAGTTYTIQRPLGDGFYVVTITNYFPGISTNNPLIESRGYVALPTVVAARQPGPLLAAVGVTSPNHNYLGRGVRAATRLQGLFTKAMVAKGHISLSGSASTDSFDSTDPALSTNGQYDPAKTRDRGDVATNGKLIKEINATGNVRLRGRVSTGPGGTVGLSGNTSIGSKGWVDRGQIGIEPGWFADDMNVNFPDVGAPFKGGYISPGRGEHNGTNYTYVLGSENYKMDSLNLSGKRAMVVTGDAVLYVTGEMSLSGQAHITIVPGASLKIYSAGNVAISGQGIANKTGQAENFFLFGLPTCHHLSLSGNSAFIGVIYAPQASFRLSGGGHDPVDFIGASITGTVSLSGHYKFHYDEALANVGPLRGYVVTDWNELTPEEVGRPVITGLTY